MNNVHCGSTAWGIRAKLYLIEHLVNNKRVSDEQRSLRVYGMGHSCQTDLIEHLVKN